MPAETKFDVKVYQSFIDFELCKLSNKYYCKKCNLWKCRCDNIVNENNINCDDDDNKQVSKKRGRKQI